MKTPARTRLSPVALALGALGLISAAVAQSVTVEKSYLLGEYRAIDPEKASIAAAPDATATKAVDEANLAGQFDALAKMTMFPAFMFVCYLALFLYFKGRGGYKPVVLGSGH